MASAWSQLDQLLTCAICLDRYRNPKLLPCQHTFCMEPCLDGLIDYARRQIKCPECRAEHRIPYKGIQEYPTNVTLMRFLELHRDITGEEPEPPPSMMERCGVCSEKANLEKCAHCDKKICPDCKEAHIDILRREINRINNQVRRGLHRLADALSQTKKNAEKLQQNCSQVKDEIEDIVRRYAKDLKHTEEKLKVDLQMYTETELKAISKLKEDLEAEVSNMSSNCDLVDKHIKDDEEWSDAELLEYKDIFIKMLDFLRSFDADTTDYSRKIKFQPRADPDVLHRNIADFGELKINAPPSSSISQQSLAPPSSNALMRSQSDHRLAAQFARRTEGRSFADRYGGSDSERDPGRPTSPLYGRGRRETDSSSGYRRYTRDYDSDRSNRYTREENVSSSILSSRWRDSDEYGHRSSRYPRDYEDYDSEPQQQHSRSVRFADDPQPRERIFDVDEATKGPLSGVIRLMDSPKLMERLHQNEVRQKQQQTEKEKIQSQVETPPIVETRAPVAPQAPPRKTPVRQASEDDIDRQKKANQANSSTSSNTQSVPSTQDALSRSTSHKPSTDTTKTQTQVPVRAQRKELVENSAPTTAEISNSIERQETRVRKQPSIAETVEEPEITTPSITRQVETEPKPKLDYNVDLSPKSPPLSPVGNSDEGEVLTQNQGDTTTCDNDSNTPRRQVAYTRHRSDTRYDRPTSRLGLVYQNPHPIPEEKPNSPTMTTSVLLSRYRPLRRSMEDYRGQERPNYNRFRDTALSRTPSIGDITFSRSPDLPIGDRRSPTASRYSPLYHHRTTHFPVLESSNDGNCSSDSCRTCLSQCSSCSSLGDYFDADSQISSESDIYEYDMRSKPALGKTVISDGRGSTTTQQQPELTAANTSDTKPTSIATSHPSLLALRSKRHENEENNRKEEVPIPAQSSFFSRQRRLPDPEPRLLENQTSEEDDDEDDDDVDEDDDDDEEEDETEDEDDVKLPSADSKLQQSANKSSTEETVEESESEESSSESSTTESESEDSDAVEDDNRGNGVQGSSHDADNKTTTTTYRSPSPKYESPLDDDEDDDDDCEVEDAIDYCSQNQTLSNDKKLPSASIDTNASRTRFRRRSDDLDTADSSSGSSSSTNYKSFSNTPTILSNGNVENNSVDSENNSSNSSHRREPRFANVRKRPTLARSKSSHELGLGYEDKEEVDDDDEVLEDSNVTPKYRSRSDRSSEDNIIHQRPCRKYGSLSSDNHSSMESTTGLSPTSSSWATYLKNKYSGNGTGRVVPRSRSSHSLYQKTDSESSDDEPSSSVLGGSMSFPNARSTYMQKRRMLFKIGSRGTEPGNFTWPRGIAVGPEDSIVVADSSNHRVQVFDVEGHFSFEFGSYGSSEGQFDCLSGVSVNRIGQFIVSDRYNHRVQLFDPSGRFLRAFGSEGHTDGRFNYPWGITTDSLGFIYVCDKDNHRVQVFQSDGTFVGKFGCLGSRPGQLEHPHYIAVSNTNRVVVSDSNNHRVQIYDVNGRTLSTFGSEGSGEGQFKFPRGVAVDDQGFIIVGDSGNNRIQIFHPDGTFLRGFGTWGSGEGEFKGLEGIAVASSGNILVCDRENHRIQVF